MYIHTRTRKLCRASRNTLPHRKNYAFTFKLLYLS